MTRTPQPFVVTFEHAKRSFKCVRLDWSDNPGATTRTAQWIVTIAGRPVWSFDSAAGDTKESVQAQVERWWDTETAGKQGSQRPLGS
jgi:hypothetical protein